MSSRKQHIIPRRVRIRRADLTDRSTAHAVLHLLDLYARDPMGLGKPLPPRVRRSVMAGLRAHSTARVFLAKLSGESVGLAVCFVGFSTFSARRLINIHDLFVHPSHRDAGIGRALLEAVRAYARRIRCCRVTLEVRTDNPRAQSLYRKTGFRPGNPPYEFWAAICR